MRERTHSALHDIREEVVIRWASAAQSKTEEGNQFRLLPPTLDRVPSELGFPNRVRRNLALGAFEVAWVHAGLSTKGVALRGPDGQHLGSGRAARSRHVGGGGDVSG